MLLGCCEGFPGQEMDDKIEMSWIMDRISFRKNKKQTWFHNISHLGPLVAGHPKVRSKNDNKHLQSLWQRWNCLLQCPKFHPANIEQWNLSHERIDRITCRKHNDQDLVFKAYIKTMVKHISLPFSNSIKSGKYWWKKPIECSTYDTPNNAKN